MIIRAQPAVASTLEGPLDRSTESRLLRARNHALGAL